MNSILLTSLASVFSIYNLNAQSTSTIPSNAEKTINFTTTPNAPVVTKASTITFNDGDAIYSTTNFGGPIMTQFNYLIPTLVVWLDEELIVILPMEQLQASQETTLKVGLFPNPATYDGASISLSILEVVCAKITPGTHKMTVGWTASGGSTKSELGWYGEIILNAGDASKWKAIVKKLNGANVAKVGLPEAAKSDPALEAKMVAFTNKYAVANGWKEKFSKAVITTEWQTIRNDLTGVILGRTIDAAMCATWPDGHCTFQIIGFKQDYDGTNYSSALIWGGVGDQSEIECEKIK